LLLRAQNLLHSSLLFIRQYYFHNLLPTNTISNKSIKCNKSSKITLELHSPCQFQTKKNTLSILYVCKNNSNSPTYLSLNDLDANTVF
jgi:hypothetical protein